MSITRNWKVENDDTSSTTMGSSRPFNGNNDNASSPLNRSTPQDEPIDFSRRFESTSNSDMTMEQDETESSTRANQNGLLGNGTKIGPIYNRHQERDQRRLLTARPYSLFAPVDSRGHSTHFESSIHLFNFTTPRIFYEATDRSSSRSSEIDVPSSNLSNDRETYRPFAVNAPTECQANGRASSSPSGIDIPQVGLTDGRGPSGVFENVHTVANGRTHSRCSEADEPVMGPPNGRRHRTFSNISSRMVGETKVRGVNAVSESHYRSPSGVTVNTTHASPSEMDAPTAGPSNGRPHRISHISPHMASKLIDRDFKSRSGFTSRRRTQLYNNVADMQACLSKVSPYRMPYSHRSLQPSFLGGPFDPHSYIQTHGASSLEIVNGDKKSAKPVRPFKAIGKDFLAPYATSIAKPFNAQNMQRTLGNLHCVTSVNQSEDPSSSQGSPAADSTVVRNEPKASTSGSPQSPDSVRGMEGEYSNHNDSSLSPARLVNESQPYVGNGRRRGTRYPDDKKDEAYWVRRKKNNEAAKRSRDARRQKEDDLAITTTALKQDNLRLTALVDYLQSQAKDTDRILIAYAESQQRVLALEEMLRGCSCHSYRFSSSSPDEKPETYTQSMK